MDKNKIVMIAVGAGILGLVSGMAIASFGHGGRNYDDDKWGGMGMMEHSRDSKESDKKDGGHMMSDGTMMGGDMGGMHDMGMMVGSEREFIMGMIPHHEEAVATAKEVVARGGSTREIKALAEGIITAQEKEIADMKTWYKNWYGVDYVSDNKYQPMMRPLANLSGAELDKVFLSDMVKHHMMAIMMAKSVDAHIEHDEIRTLSANIKSSQSAEITIMQNLLKTLK
jgi:uncharacterized protein (DUF305 family)